MVLVHLEVVVNQVITKILDSPYYCKTLLLSHTVVLLGFAEGSAGTANVRSFPSCCWARMAPNPTLDASVYNRKGIEKSGYANTGFCSSTAFSLSYASAHSAVHSNNLLFSSNRFKGAVILENPLMNRR